MKRFIRRFNNNGSAIVAMLVAMALPVAYTNCSNNFAFEATEESQLASLNSSGVIVINGGSEFTTSQNVTLSISHIGAEQMYVTNDPTCSSGGSWQTVASSLPWVLATANSDASVYVKFSNDGDGGIESECLSDAIVHDDIAPSLAIATSPALYTNASDVEATFTSSDAGSGLDGAICPGGSGTAPTCDSHGMSLTNPSEGPHTYSITVKDRAGNTSAPRTVTFTVDRTAPLVQINMQPSSISNQLRSEFRVSGVDSLSGIDRFECRMGAAATFSSLAFTTCAEIEARNMSPGQNRFEVRSVDRAGNLSAVSSYAWLIDTGAPTVMITRMPGAYSNQVDSTFEFVGMDDSGPLASYECSVDGGAAAPCTSPRTVNGLAAGPHSFSVVGTDQAGNRSQPATYNWIVDLTAPALAFVSRPGAITNSLAANFVLSATDANGVEAIECSLNGGAYQACTSNAAYTVADGDRSFSFRARDRAGNVATPLSYNWKVDTSKPVVTIASGPARWVNVRAATIEYNVADANVATALPAPSVECKLNDGSFGSCVNPATYSSLNEGSYLFVIRATDAAGNRSDEVEHMWGVDLTPPVINFGRQPLSVIYVGQASEIGFLVTDATPSSGIASVMCGLTNAALAPCQASDMKAYQNLPYGNYTFRVVAKDNANNERTGEVTWQVSNRFQEIDQMVDVRRLTKIDVLVVIDNSGSMRYEHQNMANRFGSFLDQLNGMNWQVGIVTTDARTNDATKRDGQLVEFKTASGGNTGQYKIDSSMGATTARQWFASTIQMATDGSGSEQGIAMTYRAIERGQSNSGINARNYALFRPDAALAVLVVTDADETNANGTEDRNRPEYLLNYVRSVYPNKPFSYHSIIVPVGDANCDSINGNEDYGVAYDTLSRLTGGTLGSVCEADYGSQLSAIGQATQDLVKNVNLDCMPLDTNNDGQIEMRVVTSNGSMPPAYTITGQKINFATPLPLGVNHLIYNCVRPL